ncbi:MAG: dTDP-4-dehydrorhamnose 3,5-epimerase [Proteobacteria bacterium]|nr:dTDP-4-dehydrorhamnose 3,5-epimerase [Pseudomonadota bacterium]
MAEMEFVELPLAGLVLAKPRVFRDERGFFVETYSEPRYRAAGISCTWVQDNHSRSAKGTLRGMHFQTTPGQAKLVRCASGTIWDVAVDIRKDSPTFGRWHAEILDGESHHQLFVPIGFAHGFVVLSASADVVYKVSSVYDGATESGFAYRDPAVAIAWPIVDELIVSARDRDARPLAEVV